MDSFSVKTSSASEMLDVTPHVEAIVRRSAVAEGLCCVYVPHTTAGVTINENADPAVRRDILHELGKVVPLQDGYTHAEGNSAAHVKATLVGASVVVPVESGRLALGPWQAVFLCEFDGPRTRRMLVSVR